MARERIGAAVALTTAFSVDGTVDIARTASHARRLMERGIRFIGLFGTTGEGASIGLDERGPVLDGLIAAGIAAERIIVGVSAASIGDAIAQWRLAADRGCSRVLITPPFYYKGVDENGVEAWFADVFEGMRGSGQALLYTIPSVTGVSVSATTVTRLREKFPGMVAGVKDSTGMMENTLGLLEAHGDLEILVGHEPHVAAAMRRGASGCISGVANILPERVAAMVLDAREDAGIDALIPALLAHPVVPAVKALVAHREGDPAWAIPRPPLRALSEADATKLVKAAELEE